MVVEVLKSMRPRQWAKNTFVLAPLLFALEATHPSKVFSALLATLLYCLVSGSVYLLNDIVDRESDRNHPEKRHRPIASGHLPVSKAWLATFVLAVFSLAVAFIWNWQLGSVLLSFLALNVAYSFALKRVPVLDILVISAGFLLRVVGGAVAIDVPISRWILACTVLLSTFLGLGKRIHELKSLRERSQSTRKALRQYSLKWAIPVFTLVGIATVVSFALYAVSERAQHSFGSVGLVWTTPLVALGIYRFGRLSLDETRSTSPTDALLSDSIILISALLWSILAVGIIYFPAG